MRSLTISQINRLGEQLKKVGLTDVSLALLSDYRDTFIVPTQYLVEQLRDKLSYEISIRQVKTHQSIIDKLHREKTRLSKMQDVGGCRIVVPGVLEQINCVKIVQTCFPEAIIQDTTRQDVKMYRAVHVIVEVDKRFLEIQIRTELQHLWAQLSETFAYFHGKEIKYEVSEIKVSSTPLLFEARDILKDLSGSIYVYEKIFYKYEKYLRLLKVLENTDVASLKSNVELSFLIDHDDLPKVVERANEIDSLQKLVSEDLKTLLLYALTTMATIQK